MTEKHLTDNDLKELDKTYHPKDRWDGIERRKAHSSCVDPYHDRRKK